MGNESFAGADLNAVRHNKRRHFPLCLFPAQHSQLPDQWWSQEPRVVWWRWAANVQSFGAETSNAAQHAVLGLWPRRVLSTHIILCKRSCTNRHRQTRYAQCHCHCCYCASLTDSVLMKFWLLLGSLVSLNRCGQVPAATHYPPVNPDWFTFLVLSFWYQLTRVVPDKVYGKMVVVVVV